MDAGARLRILYSFPHPVGAPGIGTTALNQVKALAEAGADVTLICTSLHAEVPQPVRVHETLRVLGRRVPHRMFGKPDRALRFHDSRVAHHLQLSQGQFDVVHTWPQSCLETFREARTQGVVTSREVPNTHTANAYEEAAKEATLVGIPIARGHSHQPDERHLKLEEQEYAQADLLMVPSDHVAETFLERGISPAKLRRHQYGYDPHRYSASGRTEVPTRPFTAAFVGRAEPRKGLHYALQAWFGADPPSDATLKIAGGFVDGYKEHLAPHLSDPTVSVLGFVDDVPTLLRQSDVLILPSVEEGSALVTYEAQASGCIPLVSSAAGALLPPCLRELVHAPRAVAELTEQLSRVMHDERYRTRLRIETIAWAPSLTWTRAGERMVEIYRAEVR